LPTVYQRQVDELIENGSENDQLKPSPLQRCLDPRLLRALVQMKIFEEFLAPGKYNAPQMFSNAADLSHEVVEKWVDFMAESVADNMPSRIDEVLGTSNLTTTDMTPEVRRTNFHARLYETD
jgi:hypothetical protein